ncbi:MAG TPA: hypothetical protein VNA25_24385 [Phycisphaerae bacterium]|nr:hypothetical protein [Phycisphaerae bacterium]
METEQALDGYRELADVTGWPEWEDGDGERNELQLCGDYWIRLSESDGDGVLEPTVYDYCAHEALCLWERHVRLWLRKRGVWLQPSIATELYIVRCEGGGALVDGKWKMYQEDMPASAFCYAAAQQAAVRAMKEAA